MLKAKDSDDYWQARVDAVFKKDADPVEKLELAAELVELLFVDGVPDVDLITAHPYWSFHTFTLGHIFGLDIARIDNVGSFGLSGKEIKSRRAESFKAAVVKRTGKTQ